MPGIIQRNIEDNSVKSSLDQWQFANCSILRLMERVECAVVVDAEYVQCDFCGNC